MKIHRGHTPNEIMRKGMEEGRFSQKPIVVPGSTEAANLIPMIHARVVQARNLKDAVENIANYKLI